MRMIARWAALLSAPVVAAATLDAQAATPRGAVVVPDGTRVRVEIADTWATRQQGLMFRKTLAANEGMIFVFDKPGYHAFWMKNTLIPLDMLWLDQGGRVVSLAGAVPPCQADPCPSYGGDAEAMYVVEVVAGFARQHGVKVGDRLKLENIPKQGT